MNIALLTAAGNSERMHQDIPKQFIHIDNKPIIVYTMEAFQTHPSIDAIIVVTLDSWKDVLQAYARQFGISKLKWIVSGGKSGQESIYKGLKELEHNITNDDVIIVHDGNRPLVTHEIISDGLAIYRKHGNSVAAIPCTEVVFESDDGQTSCKSTPREKLFRTQTPHIYKFSELLNAHEEALRKGILNTAASCLLMKELGKPSWFSKGSEENIKITYTEDLKIFSALLHTRQDNWIRT